MKKTLSLVLALIMLLSILPVSAMADGGIVLRADSITALVGTSVDINIRCESNPGISGLQFKLEYDSDLLTLTGIEYADASSTGLTSQAPQKLDSPVSLTWYNGTADSTYNGVLATLHFSVNENAGSGIQTEVKLQVEKDNVCNLNEQNVNFTTVDGVVLIVDYIPGDINNDRNVNIKDLIRLAQYLADWDVEVVESCLDTNGDGNVNIKDLIRLAQYLADWEVELFPKPTSSACTHNLTCVEAKAATCVAEGNSAYWVCRKCGKMFSDADAHVTTTVDAVKLPKNPDNHAHLVTDAAVPATTTSTGLTEGSHCDKSAGGCGKVIVAQEIIPILVKSHSITYNLAYDQPYLSQKLDILEARNSAANNPSSYNEGDEFIISGIDALDLGFKFKGWYTASGTLVDYISSDDTKNFILYAHWEELEYSVQYNVFKTPVADVTDTSKLSYKVSKGLYSLPNPDVYNYYFLGWYDENGNEVTEIPAGSTGNRVLNAYFATKRNYAKATSLSKPVIVEDMDNSVIYFAYEIGTISNVPVSDPIWSIQTVSGLSQKHSETRNTTVSSTVARTMSNTVASATQNSHTWAMSSEWGEVLEANEAWCQSHNVSQSEAKTNATTSSGSFSTTDSYGGSSTSTDNTGTTTLDYNSANNTSEDTTNWDINSKVYGEVSEEVSAEVSAEVEAAGVGKASAKAGAKTSYKVGGEVSTGYEEEHKDSVNSHTGSDTTTLNTHTSSSSSNWNSSTTATKTKTDSESTSVNKALSYAIEQQYGYSASRSTGGAEDNTLTTASTDSSSVASTNSVEYSLLESETVTTEYSSDGKTEGFYRCVTATDVHVFGVVGYDIGSKAYFTYTYSVADGKTYEFLDYSPDGTFTDKQVTVIPFTIPIDIYNYVQYMTVDTYGLEYEYNNSNHTARVDNYIGFSSQVSVPAYTVDANGTAYKVVGINAGAFSSEKGRNIKDIYLSEYITEIPDNAFNGCSKLSSMVLPSRITSVGTNAFNECNLVKVTASNAMVASKIASCGAKNIVLDVSGVPANSEFTINVPSTCESFTLKGGEKTFTNLVLESHAGETNLESIYFESPSKPVKIYSGKVSLYKTEIRSASDLAMVFEADNTALALSGTIVMSTVRENALLSKNVTVTYTNSGRLNLIGNMLACGTVTDANSRIFFVDGKSQIKAITSEEFTKYEKGQFKITFDAMGGTASTTEKTCYCGAQIGELPTAQKQYYTFDGWFTAADGGQKVTAATKLEEIKDVTYYAHWTRQTVKVSFNANEGNVSTSEKTVNLGDAIGTMPTPTRDYYTFNGWYSAAEGGQQITKDKVLTENKNITVYAHWTINPVKGPVKASALPTGAQVVSREWSYTLTTRKESKETSMDGFTQTGSYWEMTDQGCFNYASIPSGFDTGNGLYSSLNKSPYEASENATTKREVENVWGGYVYWHWMYDCGTANGTSTRTINDCYEYGRDNGYLYKFFDAFTSTIGGYASDTGYCNSKGIQNFIIPERTAYADCHGATRWFRFDYYVCNYTDRVKVFQYEKVENLKSSSAVTASDTISNVVEWVTYREK